MMSISISGVCSRILGELVQVLLGVSRSKSSDEIVPESKCKRNPESARPVDEVMLRALTAVFGMQNDGKIKKEKARRVVEKLGLIYPTEEEEEDKSSFDFDLPGHCGDEVPVDEALGDMMETDGSNELLREAFKIFDEDGNGYIEATELKRVLECLGLDKGWDIAEIEKMLKVVDLNLDGKVDFGEFQLMMMS